MNQNSIPIFNAFIFAKFKLKEKKNMHWQPRAIPCLRLSLSLFAIRKPVLFLAPYREHLCPTRYPIIPLCLI